MWVMFDGGFVSVVRKGPPGTLCVRARVREDLEEFVRLASTKNKVKIVKTPKADYAYRAFMRPDDVSFAMGEIAARIDYDNFKHRVAERPGTRPHRARVYGGVWAELFQLQSDSE